MSTHNSCGNLAGARQLARLLIELRQDVHVLIHRDRDFRTVEEIAFEKAVFDNWLKSTKVERVAEIFTPMNDIEHCFLQPAHLANVLTGQLDMKRIEDILTDVIAVQRDHITDAIRTARRVIESSLYKSERMQKKGRSARQVRNKYQRAARE